MCAGLCGYRTGVRRAFSLEGKTVVQFSTGTPQDARLMAASPGAGGAAYLDGAILANFFDKWALNKHRFSSGSQEAWTREMRCASWGGTLIYPFSAKLLELLRHGTLPRSPACSV